jgi:sugar porter (SP) family MFS transporter
MMGGYINGAPFNRTFHDPRTIIVSTVVAIYEVGGFIGSMFILTMGDYLGRRQSIALGAVVLIIGAILQATSFEISQLFVARVISGCGIGIMQSTIPILQAEVSPKERRGLFAAIYCTILNVGIVTAYWLDFGLSYWDNGFSWRFPTAFQIIFLVPILFLTVVVPESPRWLLAKDRSDDALQVIGSLLDQEIESDEVQEFFAEVKEVVMLEAVEKSGTWKDIYKSDNIQSRRRMLCACLVQAFQQLGGINALIYYANTLFQDSIGFSPSMSGLMSGILNTWLLIASFIPWFLLDRLGRKPLLVGGTFVQMAAMIIQSAMIYQVQNKTSIQKSAGRVAAAMLFIFEAAFTIGNQSAVWVYPSEVLPLRLRAKGSALSTASNWICNFLIVEITPPAIQNIGYKTYIIFSVLNACFVPVIAFYFKETKGLSLEEVDLLFANDQAIAEHNEAIADYNRSRIDGKGHVEHTENAADENVTSNLV